MGENELVVFILGLFTILYDYKHTFTFIFAVFYMSPYHCCNLPIKCNPGYKMSKCAMGGQAAGLSVIRVECRDVGLIVEIFAT